MSSNTKVLFGKGTLGSILNKLNNGVLSEGLIAFGSHNPENIETEGIGGAIFADGKLVSSRILDYKVENGKLYFFVINAENIIEKVEIEINYGGGSTEIDAESITSIVKQAIIDDFKDAESDLSKQVKESIKETINAVDIVKAKNGCVTVNAEIDSEDGYKKYTIDLAIDENTLEITADNKLTVKNTIAADADDIFLDKAEIITKDEDGKKYLVLTFNNTDKAALEVSLDELFVVYKGSDSITISDDYTITINEELIKKINKVYLELYGDDNDITPGMVESYRTLVSNVTTLQEKVDNLPDAEFIWQDLDE